MDSLYVAAAGMIAQQFNMDTIANNLSNVNTTGFKANEVAFQDLYYQVMRPAGVTTSVGNTLPVGVSLGTGVSLAGTGKVFFQGALQETGNQLDLGIEGDGFFAVQTAEGVMYTRDGSFRMDSNRNIVNAQGYRLLPAMTVPAAATGVSVSEDGYVTAQMPNNTTQALGRINLVRFANPAGLDAAGSNLYRATAASGNAQAAYGFGKIEQGYLERSNVEVVEEMVNLIVAQRAFETASKAVQASDDMMGIANGLRR